MQLYISRQRRWCEHLFHRHPMYVLRIVALLDADEVTHVQINNWWSREIFLSQAHLDLMAARDTLKAEPVNTSDVSLLNPLPLSYIGSALWKQVRLASNASALKRAHRICVRDLVDGVHLESPDIEEIALTEKLITDGAERLSRTLDLARGYSGRTELVRFNEPPSLQPQPQRRLT